MADRNLNLSEDDEKNEKMHIKYEKYIINIKCIQNTQN
jgi:hypothetical protein